MKQFRTLVLAGAVLSGSWAAAAQSPNADMSLRKPDIGTQSLYLAGRNQFGILQFCQANGFISSEIVELQRVALITLPPLQVEGADEAEEAGRRGIIAFAASRVSMTDAAMAQGAVVATRCRQIALTLLAQSGQVMR